MPQLKPNSKKM